jgi:hypothetical protein
MFAETVLGRDGRTPATGDKMARHGSSAAAAAPPRREKIFAAASPAIYVQRRR